MPSFGPSNIFASSSNVNAAGNAVSDIFAGFGDLEKAQGAALEGQAYSEAAALARQNEQFTKESTAIKEAQTQRQLLLGLGETKSDVAGAGFSLSGSALDILRESASQGALAKAVVTQQGLMQEAAYQEQAQSYTLMAEAAHTTANADNLAGIGSFVGAGVSALASMVPA